MPRSTQRPTLADVAREAGVSAMTVSRVINHTGRISAGTRAHVQEVIARLGYRPSRAARTLVTHRTALIGVVVPDITNPYFAEIVQGIETVAVETDHNVLLANTNESPARERAVLHQLDETTVDGIIVCSSRLPDEDLIPLLELHPAVVVVNRRVPPHLASCVRSQFSLGYRAHQAALILLKAGHTRIGYVHLQRSAAIHSIEDFRQRLAALGVSIAPEWCTTCLPTWQAGYQAGQELLARAPELTAVIGGNDLVALGVMRAAIEAGRQIPRDLAIIGGDDILIASQVTPPLTTFHVPKYDIGVMAARLLFERMAGRLEYQEYVYAETFIPRGSAP